MKIKRRYSRSQAMYILAYGVGKRRVRVEVYKALPPEGDPYDPDPRLVWYLGGAFRSGPYRRRGDAFKAAEAAMVARYEGSDDAGPQRAGRADTGTIIGHFTPGPMRHVPVGVDIVTGEAIPLDCIAPEYHELAKQDRERYGVTL